ncbi:MAG: ATP-binding protein [Candidatus Andeanibacterium colombiense]|uniref:histidine kinase n=1 Tax=Candidatus Andeanibacterium colombiense TaxID=3121345 RepID=A0AAJ6BPC5_9SPHN|nr:MAG: ATP-binding protein [Sphingomonadaceae bacterium]
MTGEPQPDEQLASLSSAVLLLAPGLVIRSANPAAEVLMGIGAKRLIGRRLHDVAEFDEARFSEWLERADAPISALSVKTRFGNSIEYKLDLILSPVIDHPGWQMLAMNDVGATETLGEGDEPFLRAPAILAHEIKNPLSAIRGAAQLLARKLEASDKAMTQLITDEVDRIAKLVDRMQSLGREQPEPVAPCNLHEVVRRATSVIAAAGDDGIELREEFDPSLPDVLGNEDALVQVLLNLVANARDACRGARNPQVVIRTRFVSGLVLTAIRLGRPVKLPIEVRVSDNGPGVPRELRDHIFEPFVTSKKNGQGLGLALVNKLVRDMDGRISHERDESEGWTHFRIHLPVAR